jgi:FkbM family methyltransferase
MGLLPGIERPGIALVVPTIKDISLIIDVGANIGGYAVRFGKIGRSYAFEPDSRNHIMLKRNLNLNKVDSTWTFNKAVGRTTGRRVMFKSAFHGQNSFFGKGERFEAETVTLDDALREEEKIGIVKIDVEGAEYDILYSTPQEIFDKIGAIIMEMHTIPGETQDLLVEFIRKKGFMIKRKGNFIIAKRLNEKYP